MAGTSDSGHERAHTDAGHTGDKIKVGDPAAAPVETDAEASGQPTPMAEALASVRQMVAWANARLRPDTFGAVRQPADADHQHRLGRVLLAWTAVLCLLGIAMGIASWPGVD